MIDIILFFLGTWMLLLSLMSRSWVRDLLKGFASSRLDRMIISCIVSCIIMVGWTKGPVVNPASRHISNFIISLITGGIRDESGAVAEAAQVETIAAFSELAAAMLTASSNALADVSIRFDDLTDRLTNNAQPVVYVQGFFPREDPYVSLTNHNIAVLAMRQTTVNNTLSRWIYFSDQLVAAPTLYAEADVGGGYVRLTEITNTYPDTVAIDGIPCVRYDYRLSPGMCGVVFSPDFDLRFGSPENGLQIGAGGIEMITNGVSRLGAEGWISICSGRVEVLHKGGVAVRLKIDGQEVTNGVYTL